jgi:hypothetical protein
MDCLNSGKTACDKLKFKLLPLRFEPDKRRKLKSKSIRMKRRKCRLINSTFPLEMCFDWHGIKLAKFIKSNLFSQFTGPVAYFLYICS